MTHESRPEAAPANQADRPVPSHANAQPWNVGRDMRTRQWAEILPGWEPHDDGYVVRWRAPGHRITTAVLHPDDQLEVMQRVDRFQARERYSFDEAVFLVGRQPDAGELLELLAGDVARERERLIVREEARRQHDAERAEHTELPPLVGLSDFLAQPDEEAEYRIDGLLPTGGNALFPAPAKGGKTTTIGNVCRSFADGDPFLGRFTTQPARVVLIDNEMDARGMRRWLRDQDISNTTAVRVLPLRGKLSTFNILDAPTRARWAGMLAGADVLIFDCLRPALDALGLDENHDAGQFLVALDELKAEAGISEMIVVHHMGHAGDRARGDSRLLGWPDVTWKITLEKPDDPNSPRYFSAHGRDVDVHETRLAYDPTTRRLTTDGGSRRDAAVDVAVAALVELLSQEEHRNGLTQRAIEGELNQGAGIPRSDIREGLHRAQQRGLTLVVPGPNRSKLHYLLPPLAGAPVLAAGAPAHASDGAPPP